MYRYSAPYTAYFLRLVEHFSSCLWCHTLEKTESASVHRVIELDWYPNGVIKDGSIEVNKRPGEDGVSLDFGVGI
jgi:hypothetical protein